MVFDKFEDVWHFRYYDLPGRLSLLSFQFAARWVTEGHFNNQFWLARCLTLLSNQMLQFGKTLCGHHEFHSFSFHLILAPWLSSERSNCCQDVMSCFPSSGVYLYICLHQLTPHSTCVYVEIWYSTLGIWFHLALHQHCTFAATTLSCTKVYVVVLWRTYFCCRFSLFRTCTSLPSS